MLNLLYVIDQLQTGGTERQLLEFLKRVDRSAFCPKVCPVWGGLGMEKAFTDSGVEVVPIHKRRRWDFTFITRLSRFIHKWPADIVHTTLPTANAWGRVAAIVGRAPLIIASERAIRTTGSRRYLLMDKLLRPFTECLIVNSFEGARHWEKSLDLPAGACRVIYNGVDVERFAPENIPPGRPIALAESVGLKTDLPIVGVVARLDPQKDPSNFLGAIKHMASRQTRVQFVWVGDGPSRQSAEEMVRAYGIGDKVRFVGEQPDTPAWFSIFDIFVLPSKCEGLPNVLIEAMAMGKAIVATDVGAVSEVVEHGVTGILVPGGDARALASAILELLSDEAMRIQLGRAARIEAARKFSMGRMVNETEALYKDLAARKGASRSRPLLRACRAASATRLEEGEAAS